MTTVITVYDVAPDSPTPDALGGGHTVYQALQAPASFPWVDLGEAATPHDAAEVVARALQVPGALSGRYEAFHVRDVPAAAYAPDGGDPDDGVLFVNCFRFAPEAHDAAYAAWLRVNAYMVTKPGYRSHRLHRRLDDDAPFGLVNVVAWESVEAWEAAHDEGFRAVAGGELPFTSHPTLCRPVEVLSR